MSDAGTGSAGRSSPSTGDTTDRTEAALESFVGRTTLRGRYLLLALALAVVWWTIAGPMSARIAGIGLVALAPAVQGVVAAVLSRR